MADDLVLNVLLRAKDSASGVITGMGSALGGMGGFALGATAAVAAIGVASVKMAGDFQAGLTTLVTSAGESKSNLQMVGDGIKQMSVDTATSTQQLVSGMYMVESAGYHGASGLQVLKASAMGARAENAPLADVANSVTSALNAYHLSAQSATWVTNDLVAAVGAGKMHMSDLASSLSNVLPVSSAFHISLQDTTAAISTMTMQGDDAASAATHLRQMILALEAPSSAGAKALKSIGLSSQDVSNEMKKSLPGAIQMITDHLKNKFPEGSAAYNAALKNIAGGSKQMMGMLELSGTHLQTFKNNVNQVSDAVKKGGNSITGWSDITQTFNFKLDQAKQGLSVLMITIGQALLPVAAQLMSAILPIVQQIANWITKSGILTQVMTLLQTVLKNVGPILMTLLNAVSQMIFKSGLLQQIMSFLVPVLNTIGQAVMMLLPPLVQIITQIVNWLVQSGYLKTILDTVKTVIQDIVPPVARLLSFILPIIGGIIQFALHTGILNGILNVFSGIIKVVAGILGGIIGVVGNVVGAIGRLGDGIHKVASGIGGFFGGIFNHVKNLVSGVHQQTTQMHRQTVKEHEAMVARAKQVHEQLEKFVVQKYQQMKTAATDRIKEMALFTKQHAQLMRVGVEAHTAAMEVAAATHTAEMAKKSIANAESMKQGLITQLQEAKTQTQRNAIEMKLNQVNAQEDKDKETLKKAEDAKNAQLKTLTDLKNKAKSIQTQMKSESVQIAKDNATQIHDKFAILSSQSNAWGSNMMTGFIGGLNSQSGNLQSAAQGIIQHLKDTLGFHSPTKKGPGSTADKWSPAFMKMYIQGIKDNVPTLKQVVATASQELAALGSPSLLQNAGRAAQQGSAAIAQANAGSVSSAISSVGSLNSGIGAGGSGITVVNNITINAPHTSAQDVVKLVLKELTFQNKRRGNFVTSTSGGRV